MSAPGPRQPPTGAEPQLVLINGQEVGQDVDHDVRLPGRSAELGRAASDERAPHLSVLDRGLHFGDGVFETIACRAGRARFLSLHLERLISSCARLKINLGDAGVVRQEIQHAAAATDVSLIKLIVTRGTATARGYAWSGQETATRVLLRQSWPQEDPAAHRDGVRVRISTMRLGENPALAGMKHLNRLEQVIARSEVPALDASELLLFSRSGHLTCGTMSNVFIVREGRLSTPRVDECGVAGVMRRVVMREARKAGVEVEEGTLSKVDLEAASEVFLTNARIGIWPVRSIDARALSPGPVTQRLQALLAPMLENPVDA